MIMLAISKNLDINQNSLLLGGDVAFEFQDTYGFPIGFNRINSK
jgi:alanyl-tRNA synthetase